MAGQKLPQVKCYSGYTYAQRPESFLWLDKEHKVSRIEEEWKQPGERLFKVITEDEKLFELCYNESEDQWWLTELGQPLRRNLIGAVRSWEAI